MQTIDVVPVNQLGQLETEIDNGLALIREGGARIQRAIFEIKERRLWAEVRDAFEQPIYQSFTHYCEVRWGMSQTSAYEHALSGKIANELLEAGVDEDGLPSSNSHYQALDEVEPGQRADVLQQAREQSDGQPTAEDIRKAAALEVGKSYKVIDPSHHRFGDVVTIAEAKHGVGVSEDDCLFYPTQVEPTEPLPPKPTKPSIRDKAQQYRELLSRCLEYLPSELRSEIEAALS
ncbi:MAG: hypothetical protein AAF215_05315 [Cyanobacteria bacterium P01_A01_bin.123]